MLRSVRAPNTQLGCVYGQGCPASMACFSIHSWVRDPMAVIEVYPKGLRTFLRVQGLALSRRMQAVAA